jgi:hypothetical protein
MTCNATWRPYITEQFSAFDGSPDAVGLTRISFIVIID